MRSVLVLRAISTQSMSTASGAIVYSLGSLLKALDYCNVSKKQRKIAKANRDGDEEMEDEEEGEGEEEDDYDEENEEDWDENGEDGRYSYNRQHNDNERDVLRKRMMAILQEWQSHLSVCLSRWSTVVSLKLLLQKTEALRSALATILSPTITKRASFSMKVFYPRLYIYIFVCVCVCVCVYVCVHFQ